MCATNVQIMPTNNKALFAHRLKTELENKEVEPVDFIKKANISAASYYRYISNEGNMPNRTALNKIKKAFLFFEMDFDYLIEGDIIDGKRKIPYYNVNATATNVSMLEDVSALSPEYFINIPMFSEGDFALRVTGDSMKPRLINGDIVICKRIDNFSRFILFGEIYLVVTRSDGFRAVRCLQPNPENEEVVFLTPYNIEQFHSQKIHIEEIASLYQVIGSISEI